MAPVRGTARRIRTYNESTQPAVREVLWSNISASYLPRAIRWKKSSRTLHKNEQRLSHQCKGRRTEFEDCIRATLRRLKRGILGWIVTDRPQNLVTGPFIYGLILPLLVLALFVSVFQTLCFSI